MSVAIADPSPSANTGWASGIFGGDERDSCRYRVARVGGRLNNRAKNSHQPFSATRARHAPLPKFSSVHAEVHNHLIRSAISSPAKSTSRDALPHWLSGALSWHRSPLARWRSRCMSTSLRYFDTASKACCRAAAGPNTISAPAFDIGHGCCGSWRFHALQESAQAMACLGLTPSEHSSGTAVHRSDITRTATRNSSNVYRQDRQSASAQPPRG